MTADSRITLVNRKGEKSASLGRRTVKKVPIERLKAGMWARPSHHTHMPFRQVGPAGVTHDPDYPRVDDDDEMKMYYAWWKPGQLAYNEGARQVYGAHEPEGSAYHVLFRDRRNRER